MPYLLLFLLILAFIYLPQLWVASVLKKYHRNAEENFPGTGGELARHLLDKVGLPAVSVEITEQGDHYDPLSKTVRLTKDKYEGKTLTSITVAAHEVGHAMQDGLDQGMFRFRTQVAKYTVFAQKLGSFLLFLSPFLGLLSRAPSATLVTVIAAFLVMGSGLIVHLVTLPVELDASFNKALPLLKTGYLEKSQHKPAEQILKAAALTYFAGALAGLLNFWRWFQLLRR
jgi:Zn-dependent membrane protease YugP